MGNIGGHRLEGLRELPNKKQHLLKLKLVLALLLSGIISVLIALFTDGLYRRWIQTLYLHYPATKIHLYGKGFYLFTSTPIIVSTAIAGMTITFLLYKQSWKTWLSQLLSLPMVSSFLLC
jgi:hypothetical protein